MRLIDLSQEIRAEMPVYPGTEPPTFCGVCCIEKNGFAETGLNMHSHTGTHIDTPAHVLNGAPGLDRHPVQSFCGKGTVINLNAIGKDAIDIQDLEPYQNKVSASEYLLLSTGSSELWRTETYFRSYPALTCSDAQWLTRFPLKGIGIVVISIEGVDSI